MVHILMPTFKFIFAEEESESSDHGKWNGSTNLSRKRSRPLPLPSITSPSGFVDMANLLQIINDLSNHIDSWPFLKPVTRAEVGFQEKIKFYIFVLVPLVNTSYSCLRPLYNMNPFRSMLYFAGYVFLENF